MRKMHNCKTETPMAVNLNTLAAMLNCGRDTASRIGIESGARIKIGKRVLYKLDKINAYLDKLAEA